MSSKESLVTVGYKKRSVPEKKKKIDRIILATNCNPHLEVDVCVIYSLAKFMKAIINIISGERGTRNKF